MALSSSRNAVYGIETDGPDIRIVRLKGGRRAVPETVYDGPMQDIPANLLAGSSDMNTMVAAAMPAQTAFIRWLHTPLSSFSKARRVLPSLLDIQIPFPLEACTYGFPAMRRTAQGTFDALAAAARIEDIRAFLSALEAAGLDPEIVEHEALPAWEQSIRERPLERGADRVLCLLGRDRTTIIVGKGPEGKDAADPARGLKAAYGIRAGTDQFFHSDRDEAERARNQFRIRVQQVVRPLQGPDRSEGALQWAWAGSGAAPEMDRSALEDLVPSTDIVFFTHDKPRTVVARALALESMEPAPAHNLRQGELAHPHGAQRRHSKARRNASLMFACGILLILLYGGWRAALAARENSIQSALSSAAAEITGMPKVPRGQEVLLAERALEEQAGSMAPFRKAFHPTVVPLVSALLKTAQNQALLIESLIVREDSVTLQGAAPDWDRCETIEAVLQEAGFASDLQRDDAGPDERVHFSVRASRPERTGEMQP